MTDRDPNRPLEERPEVAAAVDDDSTVPRMTRAEGVDPANPSFVEPGGRTSAVDAPTGDLIGDPYAAGTGATGTGTGAGGDDIRTGAEQPWEPEDLVMARGQDLTPANLERARRDLAELGRAAVERTVP
ncbi:hypothetical protein [Micromonospora sp. WMMD987]|jgi:hypothetical protein|uniref:hypothetical protein n=1 Tax=Micromonospora TaxID=1873 RepID=UPI00249B9763|nr:hypothetical protein [Micromonospora sp. WMMD987]WFE94442.1 hypothetical protein O7612_24325 [Micromonospora sp. WMMD987]